MLVYQGEKDKLFKRDFGKYFCENFNVSIVDYGFLWGHIYDSAGFDDNTGGYLKRIDFIQTNSAAALSIAGRKSM